MNEIFDMMDDEKKVSYNEKYMEKLYLRFMETGKALELHKTELEVVLKGKTIVLISPGKSSVEEREKIVACAGNHKEMVCVSVNYEYEYVKPQYIFVSNLRRFRELNINKDIKYIVTSNIRADGIYYKTKYRDLLNDERMVSDNAGLMAIKFFINHGAAKLLLAGFDGYSHDLRKNYGKDEMTYITKNAVLDAINMGMGKVLKEYSKMIEIEFLTAPKYICF